MLLAGMHTGTVLTERNLEIFNKTIYAFTFWLNNPTSGKFTLKIQLEYKNIYAQISILKFRKKNMYICTKLFFVIVIGKHCQ